MVICISALAVSIIPSQTGTPTVLPIARKDGEAEWWEETGKYMYEYLKGEALRYQEKYLK
jgi:hypothetical protein